jgi:hypothetical protein
MTKRMFYTCPKCKTEDISAKNYLNLPMGELDEKGGNCQHRIINP